MRLASYIADGRPVYGVVSDSGVVTMGERLKLHHPTLKDALAAGALNEIRRAAHGIRPDHDLKDLDLLPVIPNPGKILCVGINYRTHAAESGHAVAEKPNIFTKFPDCLVGHDGTMLRPKVSVEFDFEGELAVVIGRKGRYIAESSALDHVAGYTCANDGSVRDFIKASLITGKNFPASTPLGPWMVTADEIPDPSRLTLSTRLNGKEMQHSGTNMMIHSVPAVTSYCSNFTELHPGDVILTGTPDGIGAKRTPPVWMKAGDVLEVEISKIGTLRAHVQDER
jgi:2-keto-4-pentenoate hydratase/2-oxohepta-3-ene-1,7-dioic acid hydratase in catechol pathway